MNYGTLATNKNKLASSISPFSKAIGSYTVVHHALQDWGLICFTIAEYWAKSIVQSLLGIIGDLTFFLINSARCFGNLIEA